MAKVFKPRTVAPSGSNKNWIHVSKGGYNSCILISGKSCLPNCVGYAWGRWRELLGKDPKLSRSNAEDWFGYVIDGYKRGQTPKLGAIACWRGGKPGYSGDGAGHVAVVEDFGSDWIDVSASDYAGNRFYKIRYKKPYRISGLTFQGFIYPPETYVKETAKKPTKKKSIAEVAKDVIAGKYGNGAARTAALKKAGYDPKKVQDEVNKILSKKSGKKSITEIAREVIQGKWYNGAARVSALKKAGYDPDAVQAEVNRLMAN